MLEAIRARLAQGVELPLGRTLLVLLVAAALFVATLDPNEHAYVGLVFGMASGLAAWVVFSSAPEWKSRLATALAICSVSGVRYAWREGDDWLVMAALVGIVVDAVFIVSMLLFLLIRTLGSKRARDSGGFQFGVIHLLGATLLIAPLALMARIALPRFGDINMGGILMLMVDSLFMCLAAQWLLGAQKLSPRALLGRSAVWLVILVIMWPLLSAIPLSPTPFGWITLQAALGATLAAGYLLPRLDRYEVAIPFLAKGDSPWWRDRMSENSPEGAKYDSPLQRQGEQKPETHNSPEGANHENPGQRPGETSDYMTTSPERAT